MQPCTVAQFDSMLQRRNLLEALAQLTCNLNNADAGLSAVQNIIRPSQHFSEQLRQSLTIELSIYQPQNILPLQQKLAQLNDVIEKNYTLLMRVVKIDDAAFIKHFQASDNDRDAFQKLQAKLIQFKKQAHHSLAIRITLQDRGVQVERSKLALDQEFIAEKLAEIHNREKESRHRLHETLVEMISDNEQLLHIASGNPEVHLILTQNNENLRTTLALLESGDNIESLPTLIEEIHYETLPEQLGNIPSQQNDTSAPKSKSIAKSSTHVTSSDVTINDDSTTNSIMTRILIWFSTSHKVTWADTKHYRQ